MKILGTHVMYCGRRQLFGWDTHRLPCFRLIKYHNVRLQRHSSFGKDRHRHWRQCWHRSCSSCSSSFPAFTELTVVTQATAVLFAKAGSNVILVARRAEALKSVTEACRAAHKASGLSQGGNFASVQLDVGDVKRVTQFWDLVPSDLRNVDILGQ